MLDRSLTLVPLVLLILGCLGGCIQDQAPQKALTETPPRPSKEDIGRFAESSRDSTSQTQKWQAPDTVKESAIGKTLRENEGKSQVDGRQVLPEGWKVGHPASALQSLYPSGPVVLIGSSLGDRIYYFQGKKPGTMAIAMAFKERLVAAGEQEVPSSALKELSSKKPIPWNRVEDVFLAMEHRNVSTSDLLPPAER
jgi:hypothetical protein